MNEISTRLEQLYTHSSIPNEYRSLGMSVVTTRVHCVLSIFQQLPTLEVFGRICSNNVTNISVIEASSTNNLTLLKSQTWYLIIVTHA